MIIFNLTTFLIELFTLIKKAAQFKLSDFPWLDLEKFATENFL